MNFRKSQNALSRRVNGSELLDGCSINQSGAGSCGIEGGHGRVTHSVSFHRGLQEELKTIGGNRFYNGRDLDIC